MSIILKHYKSKIPLSSCSYEESKKLFESDKLGFTPLNGETFENKLSQLDITVIDRTYLILYHGTTKELGEKILHSKKILPPIITGSRVWRDENEDDVQLQKIYLGTKKEILDIGKNNNFSKEYYIFKVKVRIDQLFPDEDTRTYHWFDSLISQYVCSHYGEIKEFQVEFKKLN